MSDSNTTQLDGLEDSQLAKLFEKMDTAEKAMNARFDAVDKKLGAEVDKKLDHLKTLFGSLSNQFGSLSSRIGALEHGDRRVLSSSGNLDEYGCLD